MTRPDIAVAQRADLEILRAAFDSGRAIARDEVWNRYRIGDRPFRRCVQLLRHDGYPVISTSEQGSEYRRARSEHELEEFLERELVSRARDIEHQIRALRESAPRYFGASEQLALIR